MQSTAALILLEIEQRQIADQIIQGLKTAPAIRPGMPCINFLPVLLHRFRSIPLRMEEINPTNSILTIRSNYGDVLEAYAAFASSIWTADEKLTFESCKCDRDGCGRGIETYRPETDWLEIVKKECRGDGYSRLQYIIIQIFETLSFTSTDIVTVEGGTLNLEKKSGQRGRWPSSPSQFIPRGAPIAISAFIRWAELADAPAPIYLLCQATSWCPSLAPAMSQNDELLPIVQRLFHQFVNKLYGFSLEPVSSLRLSVIDEDLREFITIFDGGHQWIQVLYDHLQQNHNTAQSQDITRYFFLLYRDLYEMISHLDKASTSLGKKFCGQWMEVSALVANAMRDFLPRSVADTLLVHQSMDDVLKLKGEHNWDLVDLLLANLVSAVFSMRNQQKCIEIACIRASKGTQINLKLCSECQAVRYCSKECQRSDWKYHKKACKYLKLLVPAAVTFHEHPDLDFKERLRIFAEVLEQDGLRDGVSAARAYLTRAGFLEFDANGFDDK